MNPILKALLDFHFVIKKKKQKDLHWCFELKKTKLTCCRILLLEELESVFWNVTLIDLFSFYLLCFVITHSKKIVNKQGD